MERSMEVLRAKSKEGNPSPLYTKKVLNMLDFLDGNGWDTSTEGRE